jgi:hypothetical protein
VKRFIAVTAATLVASALGGCGSDQQGQTVASYEQQRQAAQVRNASQGGAKPSKAGAPEKAAEGGTLGGSDKGYTYVAAGKRDPFRSFVLEHAKDRIHDRGPLEQFDLAQLSVVAVVWNTERPRALVLDPSGRGYVVAEGTMIGKNDGRVTDISDNTVVVRETYVDYLGERTEKDIEMHVRQSQGG